MVNYLCPGLGFDSENKDQITMKLSKAMFCRCSNSDNDSQGGNCITTPIEGDTDLYHIDIQAGYAPTLKRVIAYLDAGTDSLTKYRIVRNLLVTSNLLTQCVPCSELLPLCRTVVDTARRVKANEGSSWWWGINKKSKDRLFSWLEVCHCFTSFCWYSIEHMYHFFSLFQLIVFMKLKSSKVILRIYITNARVSD